MHSSPRLTGAVWAIIFAALPTAQTPPSFPHDVRPLLAERCFPCHGPDAAARKAHLRLDTPDGPEGAYRTRDGRAAVVPGSPAASALWHRVTNDDPDEVMPPPRSRKERLTDEELAAIRRWIEAGARYESHWSFVPPARPPLPAVRDASWCRQPLDHFVLRRLEAAGLRPNAEADRRTLLRRVTLDLTGLPPTRAELQAFLADDAPGAYERVVDRLLASPHYGEHLARYWLDLVRFADTNGVHHDHYREMSPYRDRVIRAFNAGQPYDEFVRDQLAGDLVEDATVDQRIASGFHRLHLIIDRGTALPEESFARNVTDRVTAFGTAFLGLTLQCASCHEHKFDPISQAEFYALSGFFNNLDAEPETGARGTTEFKRGLQPPYLEFPSPEQTRELAALDEQIAAANAAADANDQDARQRLAELRRQKERVQLAVPAAMVMKERAEIRETHVLIRGNYDRPGARVERGVPACLPPLRAKGEIPTRLDLAAWLAAPGHPLTARVEVNRRWQQLFGTGLVATAEDFGAQGELPSHPGLLDWLAVTFVESGWDIKALLRRIVLSATYRQSSAAPAAAFASDPGNRLLARGARFRLDAEVVRDQVLATSGMLNTALFGKSVKPPQPAGLWRAVTLPDSLPRTYVADAGDAVWRRSVYTFWKRGLPPPQMTLFDAPSRESCVARRERTNTPLQALLLMNEPSYLACARHLAAALLAAEARDRRRLDAAFETITARLPDPAERETLLRLVDDLRARYRAEPELAAALCGDAREPVELAAWTMLVSAIYNLDETKTRG